MKIRAYVLLAGLVGICIGFAMHSRSSIESAKSTAQTYQANANELCRTEGENVAVSPEGRFVVFDQNISRDYSPVPDGTHLNILNVQCALSKKSFNGCLIGISSMAGIRLMSWGESDQSLFAIENNNNLLKIDLNSAMSKGEIVDQVRLHSRDIALTVMRVGPTDSISAQQENDQLETLRIKALNGFNHQEVAGVFLKSNAVAGAIFEDFNDLHLYTVVDGIKKDSTTKWREVSSSQIVYESPSPFDSNTALIVAKGAIAKGSSDNFKSIGDMPFAKEGLQNLSSIRLVCNLRSKDDHGHESDHARP